MFVFHDAVRNNPLTSQEEARAMIMQHTNDNKLAYIDIECSKYYGKGSYILADSICADLQDYSYPYHLKRYANDGELTIYTDSPAVRITIYNFQAMRIVGQMYNKLIGCVVSRRISFSFHLHFLDLT